MACISPESLNRFAQIRKPLLDWIPSNIIHSPLQSGDGTWKHWDWNLFTDEPEIRVGLITVFKNRPIPIHDHPGANGLLLVLNGELTISEYQLHHSDVTNNLKLAELTLTSQTRITDNEYACITQDAGNIHSLKTESEVCTVLDVLLTPYDEKQRSWYMPMADQIQAGQRFSAFRVNKAS